MLARRELARRELARRKLARRELAWRELSPCRLGLRAVLRLPRVVALSALTASTHGSAFPPS